MVFDNAKMVKCFAIQLNRWDKSVFLTPIIDKQNETGVSFKIAETIFKIIK